MTSYPGYPIYYRCKYCRMVFACGEDSLRYGGKPVPAEEAVAIVLAGRLNDRFDTCSCVRCSIDAAIKHKKRCKVYQATINNEDARRRRATRG